MTGWDFLANVLTSILGGSLISLIVSVVGVILGGLLLWKIFRKSFKRWFDEMVMELVKTEIKPIHDRLERHSLSIREIRRELEEMKKEDDLQRLDNSNLDKTINDIVLPNISDIQQNIVEIHKLLVNILNERR